jgi:DNA-binding CsgD family transcriptional regulator
LAACERSANLIHRMRCLAILGFLDLSLDDPAAARGHLARVAELAASAECVDPGVVRFRGDEVEALVALGRLDEARTVLEEFESRAGSLGRRSARAAAGRCRALLLAAGGDHAGAVAAAEAALVEHEGLPIPLERARTLLVLGTLQRRAKQKTAPRASIGEALDVFERLGASLWAQRARAELARVGGRPGAPAALTPSERRLAELVSEGYSNKQIAAALFVTPKTVETNLSRLYVKVGVHSRTELNHRLGRGQLKL